MDINNKEELEKLRDFTSYITGECPNEVLNFDYVEECGKGVDSDNCVICWRNALARKIEELSK